ncbi:IS3 family transposase [Nocardia miyunensis]|uniref:IS3 family transposase n=1 Tax=Nocardia miyunensis TaxID=282684 RepID=UPI000831CA67|nr:IS3 family transposase [Nocardia miyunensis]
MRERRRQATHPEKTEPERVATGTNQVWSWDATKLAGPFKGVYYLLLVMLDIFSRKAIHWRVVPTESQWVAKQFQLGAIAANDGIIPGYVHADNGGPMISKPVSELLIDLGITRSHSRPHVSNDNPYSEANFSGRFRRRPTPPKLPAAAWINAPAKENINTEFVA